MRALVQRVNWARVQVVAAGRAELVAGPSFVDEPAVVGEIGRGLCVLVGVTHADDEAVAARLAQKIWHLRVFDDHEGFMNRSLAETTRMALVVSQFTLYGDTRKGRRPSWAQAAAPQFAAPLVDRFVASLAELGASVTTGTFGAHMRVSLENDGPVTLLVEA